MKLAPDIYSHKDCIFAYCPNASICEVEKTCINKAAINEHPDPQTVPTGERMFTLADILRYGALCALDGSNMDAVKWFKDEFGIDITKTDNQ